MKTMRTGLVAAMAAALLMLTPMAALADTPDDPGQLCDQSGYSQHESSYTDDWGSATWGKEDSTLDLVVNEGSEVDLCIQASRTAGKYGTFSAGTYKVETNDAQAITRIGIIARELPDQEPGQPKPDQGLVKLCRVTHDQNGDRTDIRLVERIDKAALEELEEAGYAQFTGALPEGCIPVPLTTTPPTSPTGVHEHKPKPKAHHHHTPQAPKTRSEEQMAAPAELPSTGPPAGLAFAGGGLMLAGGALLLASRKWFA